MLTLLLQILSRLAASTPEPVLRALCTMLGPVIGWLPRRRRTLYSNLHHAFPDRPRDWHHHIATESGRRLIETGLLSLASPYLSAKRLRGMFTLSPALDAYLHERAATPRPVVICAAHLAFWESLTFLGALHPAPLGDFGVIFRPLRNARLDAFVQRTRERFGMKLLSRKNGFQQALRLLRHHGSVGVLFDQNTGEKGALTLLLDRVCSSSELPGLLAAKYAAEVRLLIPRRTAFWRVTIDQHLLPGPADVVGTTLALNRWLETALATDENLCASWLWSHNRWRTQHAPTARLRLEQKRDSLAADLAARGLTRLPRRTRFYVRLPDSLRDTVLALPLLRAVRAGRPDAELTLIGPAAHAALVAAADVADHSLSLPPRGRGYFATFRRRRHHFPDTWLLFTPSLRGDLEAWCTRCPQRFGLARPGQRRPLLTHTYTPPPSAPLHQVEEWTAWLAHFGLLAPADFTPLITPAADLPAAAPLGLIAGSVNHPHKRWPITHWRALIDALPEHRFLLLGTTEDCDITAAIAAGYDPARVSNLTGRTTLPELMTALRTCRLIIGTDTGGLHLANALGVPVIGLYGSTNPHRTRPVFAAPVIVLQPPDCPPTSGGDLAHLTPTQVLAAIG